ncbi:DUF3750 domain-containing protein [Aliikangiella coralliicola]|uniref:DUF3750 domain-containing protein n=1 Tax=Aliikangiella coralliicola TaxID=2592383 RepID=A0A545UF39_9GAMM|nr:DUF3750 domain-containing protein [Aliikangiella coralliicola]TQV88091.1 DUF3750 domain-containing protein [Aliikangiella coralliicola]
MKYLKKLLKFIKIYLALSLLSTLMVSCAINDKKTVGTFAPKGNEFNDAVIQVYAARTWGAKKFVSVHTWISVKPEGADEYTSYEIIGWRLRRGGTALRQRNNRPDKDWWGHQPELLLDIRGDKAARLIPDVIKAVEDYPYKDNYHAWPGPNSNTFTAYIGRQVPELGLDLPSTAIGKDYREIKDVVGMSASGSGVQASLWGLLGITLGTEEGLELNILGLNFEFDLLDLAIELPGIGRIGASDVDEYDDSKKESSPSSTEDIAK